MLSVHVEHLGDVVVVECEGTIDRSDAALQLRDTITQQRDARIIVLDLSEVRAIEDGGLGMLLFLQRWAHDHDIRLKVFNPIQSVLDKLERASLQEFDVASVDEVIALLHRADAQPARAA